MDSYTVAFVPRSAEDAADAAAVFDHHGDIDKINRLPDRWAISSTMLVGLDCASASWSGVLGRPAVSR